MLFSKRPQGGDVGATRVVRDVTEIVAITLAGCWAIFSFVYEDRIKPVNAAPDITFAGQLFAKVTAAASRSWMLERNIRTWHSSRSVSGPCGDVARIHI